MLRRAPRAPRFATDRSKVPILEELEQILGSERSELHFDLAERLPRILRALPDPRDRERLLSATERMARSKKPRRTCENLASELADFPGPARERLLGALEGIYTTGPPYLRHARDGLREQTEGQEKVVRRRAEVICSVLQQVAAVPPGGLSGLERVLAAQIEATRAFGSAEALIVTCAILERIREVHLRVRSGSTVAVAVSGAVQEIDTRRLDETDHRRELGWGLDDESRREHERWSWRRETTLREAFQELRDLFADELRCFPRVALLTDEPSSWEWPPGDLPRAAAWSETITGYHRSLVLALGKVVVNAAVGRSRWRRAPAVWPHLMAPTWVPT